MHTTTWTSAIGPVLEGRRPGAEAWLGVGLVSLSTLGGAWLARRTSQRMTVWLTVASAMMLVSALTDLLPDAWQDAAEYGVPLWIVGASIAFGFLAITYFTRKGHGHGNAKPMTYGRHAPGLHRRVKEVVGAALFGGMGAATALTVHRAVEGATLALAASAVVVIALMVHSASEGLALAALLDMARQRLWPWLVVSAVSPAIGVVIAEVSPIPGQAVPILLGSVAGVLLRTAIVGFRLAARHEGEGRLPRRQLVVAGALAATVAAGLGTLQWVNAPLETHEMPESLRTNERSESLGTTTTRPTRPAYEPHARISPKPTPSPTVRKRRPHPHRSEPGARRE
ncbi:hypothetical protein ACFLIM_14065 [Nonomuraea sp. M3C6]|uniref:Zinc transporter ZupT n=1 Tax=Nonomuraea marmarensis TaxID=3351344 RepID=A0ABW7AAE6_9ACTN